MEKTSGRKSEMCQASTELVQKSESDDDFKWEEFFETRLHVNLQLPKLENFFLYAALTLKVIHLPVGVACKFGEVASSDAVLVI
ncbi:hypothetical protein AVEN_224195-1 [Araneus ventricosus]|uniref:Uncharacterized protein n=1 Tax=Araneus ventricosus TaxID=182803 RepID=A0A4Y2EIR9_ARAVE|nr:hypothetical protein AVEN_224195-1 [Araneus ventricosus]